MTPAAHPFTRTVEQCRSAIRERNDDLRAILREVDPRARPSRGEGPLADVPYVLKDTWDTAGIVTTGGSWRHRARVPSRSSAVFTALEATGAVFLGKSNLCDLAFSPESDNHLVGAVKNPYDPDRTAGGSTGGGAAAIAAGMAELDWGSDFGGSIRMPAALCGVAGLRLSTSTWALPVDGFFPKGPELDLPLHGMGPLARSVAGIRAVLDATRASLRTAEPQPSRARRVVLLGPDDRTIGEWPTFVADAAHALVAAGASFDVARTLPPPSLADAAYDGYLCANFDAFVKTGELPLVDGLVAVASSLLLRGRVDRRLHPNTAILIGALAAGKLTIYRDGTDVRASITRIRDAIGTTWARGDLVVAPTTTFAAPRHGRAAFTRGLLAFAKLGNLTDATALAVPFGRFANGLPRSIQVLGPPGSEADVLALGELLESHRW